MTFVMQQLQAACRLRNYYPVGERERKYDGLFLGIEVFGNSNVFPLPIHL
jgi:hypothetical protein